MANEQKISDEDIGMTFMRIEKILEIRRKLLEHINPILPENEVVNNKYAQLDELFTEIVVAESEVLK